MFNEMAEHTHSVTQLLDKTIEVSLNNQTVNPDDNTNT